MRFIVYLIALLLVNTATAQTPTILQGNYISNVFGQSNFVLNPNAQYNEAKVTKTTATATRSTTTPLVATTEWNLTITSANGTVAWDTRVFDAGMKNQNCEARFTYRGFQATSKAQIKQGANVVAELALTPSATDPRIASINFPCGDLSSATTFVITDTATLAGINEIGGIYVGLATNQANIAQAEVVVLASGNISQSIATSADVTVQYNLEDYDLDNGYNPSTGEFTVKRKGIYTVEARVLWASTTFNGGTFHNMIVKKNAFTYGSNRVPVEATNTANFENDVFASFEADVGDVISVQVYQNTGVAKTLFPSTAYNRLTIKRFPSSSELVVTPETQNFYIQAHHYGSNPGLSLSAVGTKTEISNANLTLAPTANSSPVATLCNGTNSPPALSTSTTTCAVGNESLGITFNLPSVGTYEVCAQFNSNVTSSANGAADMAFSLEETALNNNVALSNNPSIPRYLNAFTSAVNSALPMTRCQLFNFTSVGQKAIRLMYQQSIVNTITANLVLADSVRNRAVQWTVRPVTANANSALYVQGPVKAAGTGTAIPAGYQFEELTGTTVSDFSMISGNSYKLAEITLQPGLYLLQGRAYLSNNSTISVFRLDISTNNGSVLSTFESGSDSGNGANNARSLIRFFRVTSAQTYYLNGYVTWSGTFVNFVGGDSFLKAYRLN